MTRIILLLTLCACMLFTSGCNFRIAKDALIKTIETMDDAKEESPTNNYYAASLTDTIRNDNKSLKDSETNQWVELYKTQLYPKSHKNISEITSSLITTFTYMSNDFNVSITDYNVKFTNDSVDTLSVIDVSDGHTRYLVDIIHQNAVTGLYDNYYIYNLLKSDIRFADMLATDINNVYPANVNVREIDLTVIAKQIYNNYRLSSVNKLDDTTLEVLYTNDKDTIVKYTVDYTSGDSTSVSEHPLESSHSFITTLDSPDGKHTAYIDEETNNLYVRDSDTDDIWIIYEAIEMTKEYSIINYVYNNKLIYSIYDVEGAIGFGIYDFKSNTNAIYQDAVEIYGIQNGILFLFGSSEKPSFTIDLNTPDYKITNISDIFNNIVHIPETGTYYATLSSYNDEIRITLYNTADNKVKSEHTLNLVSASVRDVLFNGNDLILVCQKRTMGHDYLYVIDVS